MTYEPYRVHELTIESIVEGMRDAMDNHSGALRKLALNVGANALECLLRDYMILQACSSTGEPSAHNTLVAGSNPAGPTNK